MPEMTVDEEKAATALESSIAKWESIAAGTGADHAADNCALCEAYLYHDCLGCPVAVDTGKRGCSGTPYVDWSDHMRGSSERGILPPEGWWATTDEAKAIASREVEYLKSLRKAAQ